MPSFRPLLYISLLLLPYTGIGAEKLIFALDVIRHGDRTPAMSLPTSNHTWQQGLGQLTAEGIQQEYQLGVKLRNRYVNDTHLLPNQYQPGSIYVRSTDFDRTLMSAQSLLMGLYPEGTGPILEDSHQPSLPHSVQPIPIHSAPLNADDIIIKRVDSDTSARLYNQYVFNTKEWIEKDNALKSNYSRWSKLTGVMITSPDDLISVGDTLFIHQTHHIPLPEGLTESDIDTIKAAGRWAFMAEERPMPIAKAYSTQIMTKIASFIEKGSEAENTTKYVLLSAHDSTIAGVLSYLGAPLDEPPPYASHVNFSLYENGSQHYVVKVTYNDTPVNLPACHGSECDLQTFLNAVRN